MALFSFTNLSAELGSILGAVTSIVEADTPVIVSAIPGGVSGSTSGYIALGEVGLAVITQIFQAISALHNAKSTNPVPSPPSTTAPIAPVVTVVGGTNAMIATGGVLPSSTPPLAPHAQEPEGVTTNRFVK